MQNRFARRQLKRKSARRTAATVFAQYLLALKAGTDVAASQFGGTAIPVTVEQPVTDRITRAVRIVRFNAMLQIKPDGISTEIVPAEKVAFDLVNAEIRWNSTEPMPGFWTQHGHPIWWKISGIPVEISRHTRARNGGRSMTAVVMERLQVFAA